MCCRHNQWTFNQDVRPAGSWRSQAQAWSPGRETGKRRALSAAAIRQVSILELLTNIWPVLTLLGGGKHIENFRGPQNTLVGPIWRSCGQKTRPHGHFWVPFRPNLVFGFYQRNWKIKIVSRLALWGVYPEVLRAEQQKSTLFPMLLSPFWRKLSKTV